MHVKKTISLLIILTIIIASGIGFYFWYPNVKDTVTVLVKATQDVTENHETVVDGLKQEIFTDPLKATKDYENARLSGSGVIELTNKERALAGVGMVTENEQLTAAARAKLQDMFEQQYFEHLSPDGNGPGYLAKQAGYSYIIVGENLALGNFENDRALVDAWMDSPGHRANIVHERFDEIGVAVGEGMYKGKRVWMAVQEFGLSAAACPKVDTSLKARIDTAKQSIGEMEERLEKLRSEISEMQRSTPEDDAVYEKKAQEYNVEVGIYNGAINKLKKDVDEYNTEVRAFNACIKQ